LHVKDLDGILALNMKEKDYSSITELGASKAMCSLENNKRRSVIEMTALLTVIRENLFETGKTNYNFEELVGQSFDLADPLLHETYLYDSGHTIKSAIWLLIASQDLRFEPNRSLTCTPELKKELLQTLPGELQNQL